MDMTDTLDWKKLPAHLQYLAGPAEKYGRLRYDERILDFLQNHLSEEGHNELISLGVAMARDWDDISSWLDRFDMTEHPEAALVYFTTHLLALGNDAGYLKNK